MSRVIIEVHTSEVDTRSGVSKASGKPYEMTTQDAWVRLLGQPFPTQIKVSLEDKTNPLQPGIYTIDPADLLKVGNFNSLEIDDRLIEKRMKHEKELPKASQA
jgi:hypothetical protein